MAAAQIQVLPRSLSIYSTRIAIVTSLSLLCLLGAFAIGFGQTGTPELELLPNHLVLHPGERIHYNAVARGENGKLLTQSEAHFPDPTFSIENSAIVRLIDPKGVIEGVKAGRTELVVRIPTSERRIAITVEGPAEQPIKAVPYSAIKEIEAKEFLFVGHANRDGFDSTAIAKPGIDRLVQQARKNGVPVVYFVSDEFPDWYTADRHPDYAVISEGQEHQIHVNAERVTFTGGDYMWCTLRNVQVTLNGMVKNGAKRINFVFPAAAIWVEDIWGPGAKQWYPAPMLLLTTLFARRATDAQRYDEVVVPFLDRLTMGAPMGGYPRDFPAPVMSTLMKDWTIVVRFGDRFERLYRRGNANKTLLVEFQGV